MKNNNGKIELNQKLDSSNKSVSQRQQSSYGYAELSDEYQERKETLKWKKKGKKINNNDKSEL